MTYSTFTWPVRVYYEDTDAAGIVYHTSYLQYMERARTEWLRSMGFTQSTISADTGIVFAVHRLEIDFLRTARLDEELAVISSVTRLRGSSIEFQQQIDSAAAQSVCQARVVCVCLNNADLKPTRMPPEIRTAFADAN